MDHKKIIFMTLFVIVVALLIWYVAKKRSTKEPFVQDDSPSYEAISNLASMYNKDKLLATNLAVTNETQLKNVLVYNDIDIAGDAGVKGMLTVGSGDSSANKTIIKEDNISTGDVTVSGKLKYHQNAEIYLRQYLQEIGLLAIRLEDLLEGSKCTMCR